MTSEKEWVWCANCTPRAGLEFHNPDTVYCSECGSIVGHTTDDVESDILVFLPSEGTVVHPDSGRVLSQVEWNEDSIERKNE